MGEAYNWVVSICLKFLFSLATMKILTTRLLSAGICIVGGGAAASVSGASSRSFSSIDESWKNAKTIYDFSATDIRGNLVDLKDKYDEKVVVITNVATQWGLTIKNYHQLQALYSKYADDGLRIMAFPCNQFGWQEPGSNESIDEFAKSHGVTFDMYEKIEVNGGDALPLWKFLKKMEGGGFIKWNFTKFLISREGVPILRYGPTTNPEDMEPEILNALKANKWLLKLYSFR